MAFLFLLRSVVMQMHACPARHSRLHQNQRPMRIDCQCCRLFFECFSLRVVSPYAHSNLHQYSLAAAARTWMRGCVRCLAHMTSYL